MSKKPRGKYTPEYRAQVVDMIESSGKSPEAVARDLGLTQTMVRSWWTRAKAGQTPDAAQPKEDEASELRRLREEVRVLRMERDFLKKAAAFFAKETK